MGDGLDIAERPVDLSECGPSGRLQADGPVVGVFRDGELMRFDDPRLSTLAEGDRIVYLKSHRT